MAKIDLKSDFASYVLIHLFKDAMAKIGRGKTKVHSMDYHATRGLTVTDAKGVIWNIEVGAKVVIPDYCRNQIPDDPIQFCPECDRGTIRGCCLICEYLKAI